MFFSHHSRGARRRVCSGPSIPVSESLECRTLLAAFTPGNIVVSNAPFTGGDPKLYEYDTSGNLVQEFDIPANTAGEIARDVLVDFNGNAQIYNGTFQPELATLDPTTGTVIETRTFANWSTANNLTYGGVAAFGNYVFATDTKTGDDAESDVGIVRFDITGHQAERFASEQGRMIDVAIGLDGLVYALGPSGSPYGTDVYVFDPDSLEMIRHIAMQHQNRALAVNAEGTIFTVGGIEGIRRYDATGQQVGDTLSDNGIGGLADIDLNRNGDILIASHGGVVAFTTEALDSLTSFNTRTSNGYNFAGWVPPVSEVTLTTDDTSLSENGGSTTATITRNTDTTQDLLITLSSQPSGPVSVPATVLIPAGQSTATFTITGVDDQLALGTQSVVIEAMAEAHAMGTLTVFVTDDETAELTLSANQTTLSENGGHTSIRIHRNSGIDAPLQVSLLSLDTTELQVPATITIPAGSAVSDPVTITGVDDERADGDQTVTIQATAGDHDPDLLTVTVTDDDVAMLNVQLSPTALDEDGGSASVFVRRNTPATDPLTVEVRLSDPDRLLAPAFVTIPAGSDGAEFPLRGINDDLVNDGNTATVTVLADGFVSSTTTATIIDDDTALLTFVLNGTVAEEGGHVAARVRRNTPTAQPLFVTLSSGDPQELTVPASVIIPAGSRLSEPVSLSAVDDLLVEDPESITVSAIATGHTSGIADIDILDNDLAALSVSLSSSLLAEEGGVTQLVVHRNAHFATPLTVSLSSNDTTEATLPATVTIAAGEASSAPVEVRGVPDGIVDGNQAASLTATAPGYLSSSDGVFVLDVDTPQLTVTTSAASLSESGGSITLTVRRNTDTASPLGVTLTSSVPDVLLLPSTVTIPAGAAQASVPVTGIDNETVAGDASVSLSVSSSGFAMDAVAVTVEDDDELTGDIDEDHDFDANDSFLMHLVALSGSNLQLDQAKGTSSLSAPEIRALIAALQQHGDVDGDGDFDANDTFLIHLIKLSGSNASVDQSKGLSSLTAAEIRANVDRLGRRASGTGQSWGAAPAVVKSVFGTPPADRLPRDASVSSAHEGREDDGASWPIWSTYREWIDLL